MAETEDDVTALCAEEVKRLRETVDILTARHEAGLEDRDRLRNERDEARAEVERIEPRRQRDERDLADAFAERDRLRAELDEVYALLARQSAILTGVANALRGPPGPLASHGHHDLAERAATVVRERDAAQTHRAIAVRERDAALIERDFARADDAMHMEQLQHVDGKLAEARAELASATALLAKHLERGPLSWDDVGWDSSAPDVVRIGLREEGGALRTALIPVEKAALAGAAAALARPTKRTAAKPKRVDRADVNLTEAAASLVRSEGFLRDDVAALLGRASLNGDVRCEMTCTAREGKVVFMLSSKRRGGVFVWSAAYEGGARG